MGILRLLMFCMLSGTFGVAAANNHADNDDGFVWIDANTRIKVKPVSTVKPAPAEAGSGASAPEKAAPRKFEKKEKPKK